MRKRRDRGWDKESKDTLYNPLSWLLSIVLKKQDRIGKTFCQADGLVLSQARMVKPLMTQSIGLECCIDLSLNE